jgi:hypothetical protein
MGSELKCSLPFVFSRDLAIWAQSHRALELIVAWNHPASRFHFPAAASTPDADTFCQEMRLKALQSLCA